MARPTKTRSYFYADEETLARLRSLARRREISQSDLVRDLINDAFSQRDRYILAAVGYQATLSAATITATAQKLLSREDLAEVRKTAGQAALLLYGRLPPRPFDIEDPDAVDPKLGDLHDAFLNE